MAQKDKTDNQIVAEETPRDIAEFKKVDRAKILADLSDEAMADVVDKHPGLVYRCVRDTPGNSKVGYMEGKGYFDRPPDKHGKLAKLRGHCPDIRLMAIDKAAHEERQKAKRQKILDERKAAEERATQEDGASGVITRQTISSKRATGPEAEKA